MVKSKLALLVMTGLMASCVGAEPPIEAKRVSHTEEKERIGQLAASCATP